MKRRIVKTVAGLGLAAAALSACNPVNTGIVREKRGPVECDGQWCLIVEKAVPHDTDAHHLVKVTFTQWVNCQEGERWVEQEYFGCEQGG